MGFEKNKYETPKEQMVGKSSSARAPVQNTLERHDEPYRQEEQVVSNVYKETTPPVNEIYENVKNYRAKIRVNKF